MNISDILIINYAHHTLKEAVSLFQYIFKYNYVAKILDASDMLIDTDKIIKIINLNEPKLICFNITTKSFYALPAMVSISNHIASSIEEITVAYGVTPADLRDVGMKDAKFDFLCKENISLLNILKLIGDKEVCSQFSRDVWFKESDTTFRSF